MRSGLAPNMNAIEPEAREMVRAAARSAGFSVREWLNSVIIDAAEEAGVPVTPGVFEQFDEPVHSRKHNLAALHARLDDLAEQIEWLAQRYSDIIKMGGTPWHVARDKRFRRNRWQTRLTD